MLPFLSCPCSLVFITKHLPYSRNHTLLYTRGPASVTLSCFLYLNPLVNCSTKTRVLTPTLRGCLDAESTQELPETQAPRNSSPHAPSPQCTSQHLACSRPTIHIYRMQGLPTCLDDYSVCSYATPHNPHSQDLLDAMFSGCCAVPTTPGPRHGLWVKPTYPIPSSSPLSFSAF